MLDTAKRLNPLKIASHVSRVSIGLLFIFSGFVKCIDPMGTLLKIEEYIEIYGLDVWIPVGIAFSIWLCSTELMMGLMLLFKVRIRFVSVMSLFTISFFTVLTFLGLTFFPVEDCGCYGEALTLTPLQTFLKNLLILPLSFIVFWRYRKDRMFAFKRLELFLAALFFCLSVGLGTYCYRHLPLIDLLDYKVGLDMREAKKEALADSQKSFKTILIYKNKLSGELREFAIEDSEWQDDKIWEWVETRSVSEDNSALHFMSEFALMSDEGEDVSMQILEADGTLNLIFVSSQIDLDEEVSESLSSYISSTLGEGERVFIVSPEELNIERFDVPLLQIDQVAMLNALRAKVGLIRLRDGVIVRKSTWRDM